MSIRFANRLEFIDFETDEFLRCVARLGGYCTVDQAQRLGLAKSPTRTIERLKALERAGFLNRAIDWPVVYQISKSTTRLLGIDSMARRPHPIETIRCRLLAVNFYLEARSWPAEFVFDHEGKIAAFIETGCSLDWLPTRGGAPYLFENLVMKMPDGRVCVSIVDRAHNSALLQTWRFIDRFRECLALAESRLLLRIAVGSEGRLRCYGYAFKHRRVQAVLDWATARLVSAHLVRAGIPRICADTQSSHFEKYKQRAGERRIAVAIHRKGVTVGDTFSHSVTGVPPRVVLGGSSRGCEDQPTTLVSRTTGAAAWESSNN